MPHHLTLIHSQQAPSAFRRRLGQRAVELGHHWQQGQIGVKGQVRLLREFHALMPLVPESIVRIIGPIILQEVGSAVAAGETDDDALSFLEGIVERKAAFDVRGEEVDIEAEIEEIEQDLELISRNWMLRIDPHSQKIDLVGWQRTSAGEAKELVIIATIGLMAPLTEDELSANIRFLAKGPERLQLLLDMLSI